MHRLIAAALAFGAAAARAHGSADAWNTAPGVLLPLLLASAWYALGVARAWRRAGAGRGIAPWRAVAGAGGLAALAVALLSPLDAAAGRSFALHMVQHELLMVVAAPLLCVARPLVAALAALPPPLRARVLAGARAPAWAAAWSRLSAPLVAWGLHAAVLWGWHWPPLFDASLASEALHRTQHAAFLGTALLFWWSVLGPPSRAAGGPALLSLFTTLLHSGALGALLALSATPWYAAAPGEALADQQLGGLLMWGPGALAYLAAALALARRWTVLPRQQQPMRPPPA